MTEAAADSSLLTKKKKPTWSVSKTMMMRMNGRSLSGGYSFVRQNRENMRGCATEGAKSSREVRRKDEEKRCVQAKVYVQHIQRMISQR